MAVFDSSVMKIIIDIEGGYVNDPDDPGGETKYGISKARYPFLDIKNLTVEQAENIYVCDYWNQYHLSLINSQAIANKVMIALINMNPIDAVKALQATVCNFKIIPVDGVLGSETINNVNSITAILTFLDLLRLNYIKTYFKKVEQNRRKEKYFYGWIRRALL